MFKITSKQPISWDWASFALVKGENEFPSRQSVPTELWPKLKRFRDVGILEFESEFDKDGKLREHDSDNVVLAQLTERQLYAMSKDELAELAKANGVDVKASDESVGIKKRDLLEALVSKLPKPPEPEEPAKAGPPAVAGKGKAGKGGQQPAGPVTIG